jgi:Glycosyltransferase like family 2
MPLRRRAASANRTCWVEYAGYIEKELVSHETERASRRTEPVKGPLIALIVPVWGDDMLLVEQVNRLPGHPESAEWIIAAVEPSETLWGLERSGKIRLVVCDQPSRGAQMNAGASKARGSLLCFHHADSRLEPEHIAALARAAKTEEVIGGAFHRRFANQNFWMKRWEKLLRSIIAAAGPLFGDQSIFVKVDVFRQLGGFADIPLMEDIEFSRRLRRMGRITLLDPPVWSSPRRFRRLGNSSTLLLNTLFIALFYLGISPHTLHRWYYSERFTHRGVANRRTPEKSHFQ